MSGYEGSFKDIDIETFNNLKICDKYTPMDFFKLKELMTNNPNLKFILDIKESKANYNNCLKYVNNILGDLIINIIPQVYNIDDLRCCINNNFKICLVALWKYHSYIHSENTLNFINELIKFKIKIFGISIFFKNYNTSNFRKNYSNTRYKIYFHGQNLTSTEIESYNNIGIHFFA